MGKLKAGQVHEIADHFLDIGRAIGDYRYSHIKDLQDPLNNVLKDLYWSVLNTADSLYTTSATLVIDDVEKSMVTISNISSEMQKTYKSLIGIQEAIDCATGILTLGVAILNKDPEAIKLAMGELIDKADNP